MFNFISIRTLYFEKKQLTQIQELDNSLRERRIRYIEFQIKRLKSNPPPDQMENLIRQWIFFYTMNM